eukprot:TRINITY_DN5244_c0_g1_i1.p1 TRINITY_DN5244_c0_g1~~TRINITY_DN5244_c0_g1_i1.p1  ORF type:complete len:907 (-),score=145.26 TRINITY_DN5244_c0_g1_i1:66-2786(-)
MPAHCCQDEGDTGVSVDMVEAVEVSVDEPLPPCGSQEWEDRLEELLRASSTSTGPGLIEALRKPLGRYGLEVCLAVSESDQVPLPTEEAKVKVAQLPLDALDCLDLVQFLSPVYYFMESDRLAVVNVVRLGKRETPASIEYSTISGSAKSGEKYVATSGLLEFGPGEIEKDIHLLLLEDDCWQATQDFVVQLSNPQGMELSAGLAETTVKIIDDDVFPSNRFADALLRPGPPGQLPDNIGNAKGQAGQWRVMFAYFALNFRNKLVRRGSFKCFFADQLKNLFFVAEVFLQMFLVDEVIGKSECVEELDAANAGARLCGEDPDPIVVVQLLAIAGIRLLMTGVEHIMDYSRCYWRVGGTSRKFLQSNLLRRNLAYTAESRALVGTSMLTQAVTTATREVVHKGYLQVFPILKGVGNLIVLAIFTALNLGVFGLLPIFLFPLAMLVIMRLRDEKTNRAMTSVTFAEIGIIDHSGSLVDNYRSLTDFGQRSDAVNRFEGTIGKYNAAFRNANVVSTNNKALTNWLGEFLVALIIFGGGYYVITKAAYLDFMMKAPTIGVLLGTIKVFQSLGKTFNDIYKAILDMMAAAPSMEQIVILLNLSIDDPDRMRLSRHCMDTCRHAWKTAREGKFTDEFREYLDRKGLTRPIDFIPIEADVSFCFPRSDYQMSFKCEIRQGELVGVITGSPHSGKQTFLKLLAGVLIPTGGNVFIAPHLRMIHVGHSPLFFRRRNLLQNLCLGLHPEEVEESVERVHFILRRLGLKESLIRLVTPDGSAEDLGSRLSQQELQLLNIARALIAGPEVLIAHTPLQHFEEKVRLVVEHVLRDFVDQRGLMEDETRLYHRHPRTCIFTMNALKGNEEREMLDRMIIIDKGLLTSLTGSSLKTSAMGVPEINKLTSNARVGEADPWSI